MGKIQSINYGKKAVNEKSIVKVGKAESEVAIILRWMLVFERMMAMRFDAKIYNEK